MAALFKPCSVDGCNADAAHAAGGRAGYCNAHYLRVRKHGNPYEVTLKPGIQWILDHVGYDGDDCLIFPFGRNNRGYGVVGYKKKKWIASRLICTLAHGDPPHLDYHAAHSCGRGHEGCVNPMHLSWKSAEENERDKYGHGTRGFGDDAPQSKLTIDDVLAIRSSKDRECDIVRRYPFVSRGTIVDVLKRKTWKHLD